MEMGWVTDMRQKWSGGDMVLIAQDSTKEKWRSYLGYLPRKAEMYAKHQAQGIEHGNPSLTSALSQTLSRAWYSSPFGIL